MKKAVQQTYYFRNAFGFVPSDGNPLEISRRQYNDAEKMLKEEGDYIPSEANPNGEDYFEERRFLMENCFIELNASSQFHQGKNTSIIRIFTKDENQYHLKRIAEELNLPLPQWHLRKD